MSAYDRIKKECYDCNLLLPRHHLIDLTFGNVSVIDRTTGVFAIKPSGVDYQNMSIEDVVVVDLEGKVVEGRLNPSSDMPTHRRIFQAFRETGAIVHTHSRYATVFAQAGKPIPCLGTTHADYFHGDIPITRPMTPAEIEGAYEWETGNVIVERFQNIAPTEVGAALVYQHGPFVWGPTGAKAVENARVLEIVAEMAYRAMALNPDSRPLSQFLLDRHFKRKHGSKSYYGQTALNQ